MISSAILLWQYAMPLMPLFLFLFFLLRHYLSSKKSMMRTLPPSPPKLPIIGNLHQLGTLLHRSCHSLSQKHGDVMLLHLGSKPTLVVSSAEAALQVMKTHDLSFCSKPQWGVFMRILNNGKDVIGAPYGEYWRNMRSICVLELLNNRRVKSFRGVREKEVSLMVENIKMKISSSPTSCALINTREMFVSLVTKIMYRVALGETHDGVDYGLYIVEMLREMSELFSKMMIGDFVPLLGWVDTISGVKTRVNRVTNKFDDFLESMFVERSKRQEKGEDNGDGKEGVQAKNFIDVLLDLQNGDDTNGYMPLDKESIKGLLYDMFAAGIETSSTTLEWMMSEIIRLPRVMEELQREVRSVANGKNVIVEDDLNTMVYLNAVLKETLRLHPPAPLLLPRESIKDAQINGYDVASGTLVFVNAWAIARDPKYWKEPEEFIPERFINSTSPHPHDFQMIPFGYGRRSCPGALFANANMELAMANLLLQIDWKLPLGVERDTLDMMEYPGITSSRRTPLLAMAHTFNDHPKICIE